MTTDNLFSVHDCGARISKSLPVCPKCGGWNGDNESGASKRAAGAPIVPTSIREIVTATVAKKRAAEAALASHVAEVAPLWNATVETVGPMLAVAKHAGGETYRKFADDVSKAHTELMLLHESIAKSVAAPFDGLADAAKASMDGYAEEFAIRHDVSLADAHSKLDKVSSLYQNAKSTWSKALDDKSNAVTRAQLEVNAAMFDQATSAASASQQSAAASNAPETLASEKAVQARAADLAKHRGVTVERAMADGLGSGQHGDATLKGLYATASRDRTMLPYRGGAL